MPKAIPDLPVLPDPTEPKVPRAPGDCKVSRVPREKKAIQAKLGRLDPRVIPERLALRVIRGIPAIPDQLEMTVLPVPVVLRVCRAKKAKPVHRAPRETRVTRSHGTI